MPPPSTTYLTVSVPSSAGVAARLPRFRYVGYNSNGQLGSGDTTNLLELTRMPHVNGVVKYNQRRSAGAVLTEGGAVWYWPISSSDQTVTNMDAFTAYPIADVAANGYSVDDMHWCAVVEYTNVECWGSNSRGQLGDGTTTDSASQPVRVQGLPAGNITSISLGHMFSCAIVDAGNMNSTAWCWGETQYGRLGIGETSSGTGDHIHIFW